MRRPSIQRRKHLLRMNCTTRQASSIAAYCCLLPSSLYSEMNMPLALPCVFCSTEYTTINVVSSRGKTHEENQFLPHRKANGAFAHSVPSKEGLSLAERVATGRGCLSRMG